MYQNNFTYSNYIKLRVPNAIEQQRAKGPRGFDPEKSAKQIRPTTQRTLAVSRALRAYDKKDRQRA